MFNRHRPEYRIWANIVQRCTNPKRREYHRYGGRGITLCQEWRKSFATFLAHIGERPSKKHSIDRINNNKGYEPGNVRWATSKEQSRNQEKTLLITAKGKTLCLTEWAHETGIPLVTIHSRIRKLGWSGEKAVTVPQRGRGFNSSLTDEQIFQVHQLCESGMQQKEIAKRFSTTPNVINRVVSGKTHKHLFDKAIAKAREPKVTTEEEVRG